MKDDKEFTRQNSHKFNRLDESWRKPRGKHSNIRLKKKYAKDMPNPGYRKPKEKRGLHPSGYKEVLVHNPDDLDKVAPEEEAARIGSTVGRRKRDAILEKADELDIKVLNR